MHVLFCADNVTQAIESPKPWSSENLSRTVPIGSCHRLKSGLTRVVKIELPTDIGSDFVFLLCT